VFLRYLSSDPHHYVYVVVTMVFSIVLHELAHGWVALRCGDPTPRDAGHMTIDPRVHMGWGSLLMVLTLGLGFGEMPVDRTRMRGRWAMTAVALAGPLMNLLLAGVALTAAALWMVDAYAEGPPSEVRGINLRQFLYVFGYSNLGLAIFNLLPLPPLDGSTALAEANRSYRDLIARVQQPIVWVFAFMLVWTALGSREFSLWHFAIDLADSYLALVYRLCGRA
jgi:Zn-dependent protease